jgi:hypothetical protein
MVSPANRFSRNAVVWCQIRGCSWGPGRTFVCPWCSRRVCYCQGAADDTPALCNACHLRLLESDGTRKKETTMGEPKNPDEASARRRQEILDQIEDPVARHWCETQLRYAEEVEGIEAGGIFTVPGAPETQFVHTGFREELLPSLTPAQQRVAEERRLVDRLEERERWEALGTQDVFHSKPPKRDLWLWLFATISLTAVIYFIWKLLSPK